MKSKDVEKRIRKAGGELVSQKGSHRKWRVGTCTTIVVQTSELAKVTVRAIERQLEPCLGKKWLTK